MEPGQARPDDHWNVPLESHTERQADRDRETESDLLRLHEVPPLDAGYEQRVRGRQHGRHQPAVGTSARALIALGAPASISSSTTSSTTTSSTSTTWTRTKPARTMNT